MGDDLTVLRLDVDADAVRALLEAIPGVSPAELPAPDTEREGDDADLVTAPSRERTGPRVGETPPPGAGDQHDPVEESSDDGRSPLLLAGVAGAVLAVLVAVGGLLYRRRSSGAGSPSISGLEDVSVPDVGPLGADSDPSASSAGPDRSPSRIDRAPLIGMAALAVGSVVVRALRAGAADRDD